MMELLENLKKSWVYAKEQKKYILLYILCNIIGIIISICIPILSAKIIVDLTSNKFYQVIFISFVILLVELLRNVVNFFVRKFSQIIYRETFVEIQTKLGSEILKIESKTIDENSSGVFIQRLTNDTSRTADIFNMLNMYLSNIITDIGIFVAVFIINKIAFIYLVAMIIIMFIVEIMGSTEVNEKDKKFRKKLEKVSGFVGELVRGSRDIKMLNAEDSFMEELHTQVVDLNKDRYLMGKVKRTYRLVLGVLTDVFDTGMIILLVFLIMNGNLAIASAIVIHNYMGKVTQLIYWISDLLEQVKDFNLSSSRIFAIIESKNFPKEKFGKKHLKKVEGNFEFKNVTFGYNDEKEVLKNISFKVNANETVAFVGKSGAGKSTIFSLLCKMYNVEKGTITIDGIDINKLDKDSIRGNITIISQNPYIFNMSIKDNLRLVKKDVTMDEIKEACKLACLTEFIESLPDKYDTIVGEGGISLSGGQRQRLAIARAFVQKTEIILFDEATSALDNETQSQIQKAIDNLKKDYTILIIAHRLSTVINSDRILFLEDGVIKDCGTHKELLKKNKEYKLLYQAELSKE